MSRGTLKFARFAPTCSFSFFMRHRGARTGHDEGGQALAMLVVVDSDHGNLGHVGMRQQRLLDLDRIDVLTPETIISSSRPTTNSRPSLVEVSQVSGRHKYFVKRLRLTRGVILEMTGVLNENLAHVTVVNRARHGCREDELRDSPGVKHRGDDHGRLARAPRRTAEDRDQSMSLCDITCAPVTSDDGSQLTTMVSAILLTGDQPKGCCSAQQELVHVYRTAAHGEVATHRRSLASGR